MNDRIFAVLPEFSDEEYVRWQAILEERTGISFSQHKSILHKGLSLRMREIGATDYDQYFRQVSAVPGGLKEWVHLVDRVSVKETGFFRDAESFALIREFLLNRMTDAGQPASGSCNMWSVGCSTGEEAYSLAMTACDVFDCLGAQCFLGVTATDISATALAVAKQGCYQQGRLSSLSPATKSKYFVQDDDGNFTVATALRQRMCFVQDNILNLDVVAGTEMDIIVCQNVLIYFRRELQMQVLNVLADCLKPGGLLVIGSAEAAGWKHPQMDRMVEPGAQAFLKKIENS